MAEFKFPKGEAGAKVVAPNGIVYLWDATNGRWGVEGSSPEPLDSQYVRKSGDTMTGNLKIESGSALGLYVKGNTTGGSSVFYVRDSKDDTKFRVTGDGKVQAGTDKNHSFMANEDNDVVTKKYLDTRIHMPGPATFSWKRENKSSNPSSGHFCVEQGKFLYFNKKTYNGHTLAYSSGFSQSAKDFPGQVTMSGKHALSGMVKIWMKSGSESSPTWTLMQMMGAYRYRLGFGGFVQIEFKDARGNWDYLTYEHEYYISVDGFF